MRKMRRSIVFAAAMALAMGLGAARPTPAAAASSWDCTQLTSGGGGTWACTDGSNWYYVDCSNGPCVYHQW